MKKVIFSIAILVIATIGLVSWKAVSGPGPENGSDCMMLIYSTGDKEFTTGHPIPYKEMKGADVTQADLDQDEYDVVIVDGVVREVFSNGGVTHFKCQGQIPAGLRKRATHYNVSTGWDCNNEGQSNTFNTEDNNDWNTVISPSGRATLTCHVKE